MTEKLTNEDAQQALLNTPFRKEMEKIMPVSARAKKWLSLTEAKEVKVFHNEGEVVYSKALPALNIQRDSMKIVSEMMGDKSNELSFQADSGKIIFKVNYGEGEDNEKDSA